jgi:hypothetical protein
MRLHPALLLLALASCGSKSSAPLDTRAPVPDSPLGWLDHGPNLDRQLPGEPKLGDAARPDGRIDGPIAPTYGDVSDSSRWVTFNMTGVNANARGYLGAAFDGRYIYFVPYQLFDFHGIIARYDTQADFGLAGAWTTFDLTTVNATAKGYSGGAFDGRYLYLAPFNPSAPIARYDTTAPLTDASSWSFFLISVLSPSAKGFQGAVFDKHYVYFVPYNNPAVGGGYHGMVTRLDTKLSFTAANSWTVFNTATVNPSATGFYGGGFDGRYLYLVPYHNGNGNHGLIARYDTAATFASGPSWSTFDLTSAHPNAKGFATAAFDGHYLYLVPAGNGLVARYDTTAALTSTSSWVFFDLASLNAQAIGYNGSAFDGRYLYLIPYGGGVVHGLVARLDTTAPFGLAASWVIFDLAGINPGAVGFKGAAFDGRFVYLAPNHAGSSGMVFRFDAKTPPSMPTCYNGSYF